jgi:hypothetical protein
MGGGNSSESNIKELPSNHNAGVVSSNVNLVSSNVNLVSSNANLDKAKLALDDTNANLALSKLALDDNIKSLNITNIVLADAKRTLAATKSVLNSAVSVNDLVNLPQYKNDVYEFAKESYKHMDKRRIISDDVYDGSLTSVNEVCVRNVLNSTSNNFETYRVSCKNGNILDSTPITDFPNLNCTTNPNGKMYINDNNIKSLYTHNAPYIEDGDSNITTNISVYREFNCNGTYPAEHGGRNNLAKKLLRYEIDDYFTDSIKEKSGKIGYSHLIDHYIDNKNKYYATNNIPAVPTVIPESDKSQLDKNKTRELIPDEFKSTATLVENFKNKRKQQNSFINNVNTYNYQ